MSETHDPWAEVDRQMEALAAWSRTPPATFDELAHPIIGLVVAVNAVRAEATQHRQEIAVKDETIRKQAEDVAHFKDFRANVAAALCVENEQGPVDPSAIVEAADSTLSQLFDVSASLAAVEAERDRLKAALEQAREWMRVASRTLRASGGRPSRDVALTTADQIDAALSGEGTKP